MVEGFTRLTGLHFLPDDRAAADRALVTGRPVVECSDGPLRARARRARRRPRAGAGAAGRGGTTGQAANSRYSPPTVKTIIAASSGS